MEKQKKNVKNEITENVVFKKRSEMTREDILKLKKYAVVFTPNKTKGTASFSIPLVPFKCSLNTDFNNRVSIDMNTWNVIKMSYKIDYNVKNDERIKPNGIVELGLPVRFLEGNGKNDIHYHMWELYVTRNVVFSGFINSITLQNMEMLTKQGLMQPIEWINVGKTDIEVVNSEVRDDFIW